MSAAPIRRVAEFFLQRRAAGRAFIVWLIIALCNTLSQIVLCRELAPGEFGTVNTVLGLVAVLAAPLFALEFIFQQCVFAPDEIARRQDNRAAVTELGVLFWSGISIVLLLVLLPLLALPRLSVMVFAVLVAGTAFLAILGYALGATAPRARFWTGLVIGAAAVRVLASVGFSHLAPSALSGLASVVVAGFITAIPVLRKRGSVPTRAEAGALIRDAEFIKPFLAAASVMSALAIFTNADRVVAQLNFGSPEVAHFNYVDLRAFDDYHAAGMLGRGLLWGTLPLLMVMYKTRVALARTSQPSLHFFWIYLVALFAGDFIMESFAPFESWIFTGGTTGATRFVPGFAGAVPVLGLLQGVGIFALASRRYPECFTLAGCSVAYAIFLTLVGREPQLMTSCMFGGGLMSLMVVLFVGITRYARSHP